MPLSLFCGLLSSESPALHKSETHSTVQFLARSPCPSNQLTHVELRQIVDKIGELCSVAFALALSISGHLLTVYHSLACQLNVSLSLLNQWLLFEVSRYRAYELKCRGSTHSRTPTVGFAGSGFMHCNSVTIQRKRCGAIAAVCLTTVTAAASVGS